MLWNSDPSCWPFSGLLPANKLIIALSSSLTVKSVLECLPKDGLRLTLCCPSAAVCLAAGLLLVPAYVPTHLNPADGPSRFHGPGPPSESHSLSSNDEQQQQC